MKLLTETCFTTFSFGTIASDKNNSSDKNILPEALWSLARSPELAAPFCRGHTKSDLESLLHEQ